LILQSTYMALVHVQPDVLLVGLCLLYLHIQYPHVDPRVQWRQKMPRMLVRSASLTCTHELGLRDT
jgi:hypothetical protein